MSDAPGTSDLSIDEARLVAIAGELADALEAVVPTWIERVTQERAAVAGVLVTEEVRTRLLDAGVVIGATVGPRARAVLTADIDAGAGTPLAVLRKGLGPATEALRELGVPPLPRDEFARRVFPDDDYDLAPASFADVDESLHELGLMWGAARSQVHLRRRRQIEP